MKILIATHNKEKLARYRKLLNPFSDLELLSLFDLQITKEATENFQNNQENAKHKAKFYGELSGLVTIAIDEAVFTNFLPDNEQPGVYVRRFARNKNSLSDEEMLEAWREVFIRYPQADKKFIWDFAIAFYNPRNGFLDCISVEQISYVASDVSNMQSNGYPLSRILSPEPGGPAYLDIEPERNLQYEKIIFVLFIEKFKEWIAESE